MKINGHKTRSVFDRYHITSEPIMDIPDRIDQRALKEAHSVLVLMFTVLASVLMVMTHRVGAMLVSMGMLVLMLMCVSLS